MRRYLNTACVLCASVLAITLLLMVLTPNPLETLKNLITGPFSNTYTFGNMLSTTAILILCGAGMSISFQAGLFNLGGEGQIYTSGLVGALTGLVLPAGSGLFGSLGIMLAGMATGALIAGISGVLLHRYHIHELISSFLLSGALVSLVNFLIADPLRDTESYLQTTKEIPASFYLTSILHPSNLTPAIFIAIIVAGILSFYLYRTPGGYELRVTGANPSFARFGSISHRRYTILPLLINGACYGLAGALMVLSTQHAAIVDFTAGYGWNGITIALIAGTNPLLTIPAALLLAWLETGIRTAMAGSSISFDLSIVIRGIILLLITLQLLPTLRKRL